MTTSDPRLRVPGEDVSIFVPIALLLVGSVFVTTSARSEESEVTDRPVPTVPTVPAIVPSPGPATSVSDQAAPAIASATAAAPVASASAAPAPCGKLVVRFATGVTTGPAEVAAAVAPIATFMKNAEQAVVLVEGHADSVGDDMVNLRLSRERATWVAGQLQTAGVPRARITVRGLGAFSPVVGAAESEPVNRRVVVSVSGGSGCAPVPVEEIQ